LGESPVKAASSKTIREDVEARRSAGKGRMVNSMDDPPRGTRGAFRDEFVVEWG